MRFKKYRLLTLGLATAGLLAAAPQAIAQNGSAEDPAPQQQQQMQDVTAEKIDAYTDSAIKVSKIQMDMAPQIQAAENQDQQKSLYMNMQKKMVGAVQSTEGITVAEYNAISKAAQADPQLAGEIKKSLEDKGVKPKQSE